MKKLAFVLIAVFYFAVNNYVYAASASLTSPGNVRAFDPITLTCSTTPSLSGTYRIDDYMMETLQNLMLIYASRGNTFFPAMATLSFLDTSNNIHTIPNATALLNFYGVISIYWNGIADYQNRVLAGQNPTLPPSTSSSC